MKTYEVSVDIRHVLGVARGVCPLFRSRNNLLLGYQDHLRKRLASAIQDNEDRLRLNIFIDGMGQVPEFDKFVLNNLALVLSQCSSKKLGRRNLLKSCCARTRMALSMSISMRTYLAMRSNAPDDHQLKKCGLILRDLKY